MNKTDLTREYLLYGVPILRKYWKKANIPELYKVYKKPIKFFTMFNLNLSKKEHKKAFTLSTSEIYIFSCLNRAYRYLIFKYLIDSHSGILSNFFNRLKKYNDNLRKILEVFVKIFPGKPFLEPTTTTEKYLEKIYFDDKEQSYILCDIILLHLAELNPATDKLKPLFYSKTFYKSSYYQNLINSIFFEFENTPTFTTTGIASNLKELLLAPIKHNSQSLYAQLLFIVQNFGYLLPPEIYSEALLSLDLYKEENSKREIVKSNTEVIEFNSTDTHDHYPEPELFTPDKEWMANIVLIAKMVYVWLYQLSKKYNREISRLDQIPDGELDQFANWGINAIWLIGVWKRSPASQKIKHLTGNKDAIASAYSLYDYEIAEDLGGYDALLNFKERAAKRGIRLASDMVPNHTGIYSEWILRHPEWFIQTDEPPYTNYKFTGENLSFSPDVAIFIEDGYWTKTDAAVVFKHIDNRTGKIRYIYHGNDGTSTPWNDTAQLNYLLPEVRDAVIKTIIKVARLFPIIRFDAAMTLTKRHYQRLWFPQPGHGGAIPSRSHFSMTKQEFDNKMPNEFWREVVDTVSETVPDTLLLAEAFWLMEGYFVRTLGMHRVYNSAFMNMIKMEENSKYRKTIKNVIEFDPEILKRFVNFMNNPDEQTAIEQFGKEKKYFGAAVMLVTMPGLPMFGHGQIEGFKEKYGMEYKRCYWDEQIDYELVMEHEKRIFPLLKKRHIFSGSEHFVLYDFYAGEHVDENVFVYSNMFHNERAIVVYHNKFASTKGWFKTSTPFRKNGMTPNLIRKSIGEALKLKSDSDCFYVFKNYSNNLYYIKNSKQLCEQGFYLELDAYDYHVFMEFEEIIDDEEKTWKQLHDYLNGMGDENIFDLHKTIKFGNVLEMLKSLIIEIPNIIENILDIEVKRHNEKVEIKKIYIDLICELKSKKLISESQVEVIENDHFKLINFLKFLQKHKRLFNIYVKDKKNSYYLFSLSVIKDLLEKLGLFSSEHDTIGLIRYLERTGSLPTNGLTVKELFKIISKSNFFTIKDEARYYDKLLSFFGEKEVKNYIKAHHHDNTEWFHKESFEELISYFLLNTTRKTLNNHTPEVSMGAIIKRLTKLLLSATKANYRLIETFSI